VILEGIVALMALAVAVLAWEDHGINKKYALLIGRLGGGQNTVIDPQKVSQGSDCGKILQPSRWLNTEVRGESLSKTEPVPLEEKPDDPVTTKESAEKLPEEKKTGEVAPVQEVSEVVLSESKVEKKGKFDMGRFVESREESQ
jgi:hypothetical protein